MSYLYVLNSLWDEESWGFASEYRSTSFRVESNQVSFGQFSSSNYVDWYDLRLSGPGTYNLTVSKGPLRNNAFVIWRFDGVVPITVEFVSDEVDGIKVGVADDQALGV